MNIGTAGGIFNSIGKFSLGEGRHTDEEKLEALRIVSDFPTHNGYTKDQMLRVIKYLLDYIEKGKTEGTA